MLEEKWETSHSNVTPPSRHAGVPSRVTHRTGKAELRRNKAAFNRQSASGDTAKEGGVLLCYLAPGAGVVLLGFLRLLWLGDEEGITPAFL